MIEIRRLNAHDPLPEGMGRHVIILHRFDEDDPRRTVSEITLSTGPGHHQSVHPRRPDGTPMGMEEAVEAAKQVAATEQLQTVYLIDRTAGPREQDVLLHGGDHSINMDRLDDMDLEEGERGPDMRDRT